MIANRFYYSASIQEFLNESDTNILGKLAQANTFELELTQRNAWLEEIRILKSALVSEWDGQILLEYSIPRMGKRIDAVVLFPQAIVPIEFKVGARSFDGYARDQVLDYALDLKYFHHQSAHALIAPILVATDAPMNSGILISTYDDDITSVMDANSQSLSGLLASIRMAKGPAVDPIAWINSRYQPTPTIIEAAQVLYQGHGVDEISRSDAAAENLTVTAGEVNRIVDESKAFGRKSICIVTGVPGAGRLLLA